MEMRGQQRQQRQQQPQTFQQQNGSAEGPLNDSLGSALGRLGIKLSDRTLGLIAMNAAVLLYSTNW